MAWILLVLFMKVAMILFRNKMSPRVDVSDRLAVYELLNGAARKEEEFSISIERPGQLVALLKEKHIAAVACGGCPGYFMRMLMSHGLDMLPGITGDPDEAAAQLAGMEPETLKAARFDGTCRQVRARCRGKNKN